MIIFIIIMIIIIIIMIIIIIIMIIIIIIIMIIIIIIINVIMMMKMLTTSIYDHWVNISPPIPSMKGILLRYVYVYVRPTKQFTQLKSLIQTTINHLDLLNIRIVMYGRNFFYFL